MGADDLLDDVQTQNVGRIFPRFTRGSSKKVLRQSLVIFAACGILNASVLPEVSMGKVTGMVSNLLCLLPLFGLSGTVGDWALWIYTLWIAFRFSN